MNTRRPFSLSVALGLAVAIHVDWHLARHGDDHRSLGLAWHWLAAVPVFALAAWYLSRRFTDQLVPASVTTIGAAILIGQVVEALGELVLYQMPLSESFAAARLGALAAFMAAGLVSYVVAGRILRR